MFNPRHGVTSRCTPQKLYGPVRNVGCGCPTHWCCKNDKCVDGAKCLPFPNEDKGGTNNDGPGNGSYVPGGFCVLEPKEGQQCGKLNAPCCYSGDEGTLAEGKCTEGSSTRNGYCETWSALLNNGPGPKCKLGPRKLSSAADCGEPKVRRMTSACVFCCYGICSTDGTSVCCIVSGLLLLASVGQASPGTDVGTPPPSRCNCNFGHWSLLMLVSVAQQIWATVQTTKAQPFNSFFQPCCIGEKCPRDLVCRPTEEWLLHGSYAIRPAWAQDPSNELLCYFCEARVGAKCGPQTDNNVKCCADLKSFGLGFPARVMHCSAPDGSATEGNTTCAECGVDDKVCWQRCQVCPQTGEHD